MCSITMVFTCPLYSSCKIASLFRENNNVVVFQFLSQVFVLMARKKTFREDDIRIYLEEIGINAGN